MQLKTGGAEARKGMAMKVALHLQGARQKSASLSPRVDVLETVKYYLTHDETTIRYKRQQSKADMYVFFLVDSSGSMVKDRQIAYIKGLVAQTIDRYKSKRIKYAAVALSNGTAELLSAPTLHVQELVNTLAHLSSGGKTNMKAGFAMISQLFKRNMKEHASLYIFTDGKINAGNTDDPFGEAVLFYRQYLNGIKRTAVIDNESGFVKLELAEKLAVSIGAGYQHIRQNAPLPAITI